MRFRIYSGPKLKQYTYENCKDKEAAIKKHIEDTGEHPRNVFELPEEKKPVVKKSEKEKKEKK